MNPFLRRVIAQRELEQEQALRVRSFAAPKCRLCGRELHAAEDTTQRTVCTRCGGWRREVQLEREDAARAEVRGLLRLAGFSQEEAPMDEVRLCSAGCGSKLRRDNTKGVCSKCQLGKRDHGEPVAAPPREVRKQFRALTSALGIDGDGLIDRFCKGWIENLKSRATPSIADDDL